jgi:hypothetical protein
MTNKKFCYITFFGTYMVLKAERLIKQAGIGVDAVAAPRFISTECGICIKLAAVDRERTLAVLARANMEINEVTNE